MMDEEACGAEHEETWKRKQQQQKKKRENNHRTTRDGDFRKRARGAIRCKACELKKYVGPNGVDARDPRGRTALMMAIPVDTPSTTPIGTEAVQRIQALLEMKADVNARETFSTGTPLTRAVLSSDSAVVEMLLDAKASVQGVIDHGACLQSEVHDKDTREWLGYMLRIMGKGGVDGKHNSNMKKKKEEEGEEEKAEAGEESGEKKKMQAFSKVSKTSNGLYSKEVRLQFDILLDQLERIGNTIAIPFNRGFGIIMEPGVLQDLFSDDPVWGMCVNVDLHRVQRFFQYAYAEACKSAFLSLELEVRSSELGAFASPTCALLEAARKHLQAFCARMHCQAYYDEKGDFAKRFLSRACERLSDLTLGDFYPGRGGGNDHTQSSRMFEMIRDIVQTPKTLAKTCKLFMDTGGGAFCVEVLKDGIMKRTPRNKQGFLSLVPFWRHMKNGIREEESHMRPILTRSLKQVIDVLHAKMHEHRRARIDIDPVWLLKLYYTVAALINLGADPPSNVSRLQDALLSPACGILAPCLQWFEVRLAWLMCERVAGLDDACARIISAFIYGYAPNEECLDPRVLATSYTSMLMLKQELLLLTVNNEVVRKWNVHRWDSLEVLADPQRYGRELDALMRKVLVKDTTTDKLDKSTSTS